MDTKMKEKVEKIIAKIRPYVQMHGGDVHLLDIKKGSVILKVSGACAHCSLSDITYNKMLGGILKEEVPGVKKVIVDKS